MATDEDNLCMRRNFAISYAASMPFITEMTKSRTTTSGYSFLLRSAAILPFAASRRFHLPAGTGYYGARAHGRLQLGRWSQLRR
jgi:hypothetical protein